LYEKTRSRKLATSRCNLRKTKKKSQAWFSFCLNNNESIKGEGMGGEEWKKGFWVLKRPCVARERIQILGFSIHIGYRSLNKLLPNFGCWSEPLSKGVHPFQRWWSVWRWKCLMIAWIDDM
jgi:hypothetical protein